jgi:hypothetical protein
MKDSTKVQSKDEIKNKIVSMIGANQEMIGLLKKLK